MGPSVYHYGGIGGTHYTSFADHLGDQAGAVQIAGFDDGAVLRSSRLFP
jgi:hypothetical protein